MQTCRCHAAARLGVRRPKQPWRKLASRCPASWIDRPSPPYAREGMLAATRAASTRPRVAPPVTLQLAGTCTAGTGLAELNA